MVWIVSCPWMGRVGREGLRRRISRMWGGQKGETAWKSMVCLSWGKLHFGRIEGYARMERFECMSRKGESFARVCLAGGFSHRRVVGRKGVEVVERRVRVGPFAGRHRGQHTGH